MAEQEVKTFIAQYVAAQGDMYTGFTEERYDDFANKYWATDLLFIRPSGNPMDAAGFKSMWGSGLIKNASSKLLSVDTVRFCGVLACLPSSLPSLPGAVAVVTFTSHEQFTYGDVVNDDIVKCSVVLEKVAGGWLIAHAQRATGHPPAVEKKLV